MAKRPRLNNEKVPEVNAIENEASTSGAKNVEIGNVEVVFFSHWYFMIKISTLIFYPFKVKSSIIYDGVGNIQRLEMKYIPIYVVASAGPYRHESVKDINEIYQLVLKVDLNLKEKLTAEVMVRNQIDNDIQCE